VAVRIYSLANELGIDSKELVDICSRIGIPGKGSALASLEDDQILKIKSYLAERSAPASAPAKEPLRPAREAVKEAPIRETGKILNPKRDISALRPKSTSALGGSDSADQNDADGNLGGASAGGASTEQSSSSDSTAAEVETVATDIRGEASGAVAQREEAQGNRTGSSDVDAQSTSGAVSGESTSQPTKVIADETTSRPSDAGQSSTANIAASATGIGGRTLPMPGSRTGESNQSGLRPVENRANDARPTDRTSEPRPSDTRTTDSRPADSRTADSRTGEPTRSNYLASGNTPGKVRVIGRPKPAEGAKTDGEAPKVRKPRDPVINLAKIPKSAGPSPAAKPQEPAAMKPIVKLTPEVLKGVQQQPPATGNKGEKSPATGGGKFAGAAGRATAPSQTQHAGLTEFKQAAENKLNQKTKKAGDEPEEPVRKKGLGSLESARSERSKLRLPARIQTTEDLKRIEEEEERRTARPKKKPVLQQGKKEKVTLAIPCTVRSFSEAAGVPAARVLRSLMMMGTMVNINASLTPEQAELIAVDLGIDITFKQAETLETSVIARIDNIEDKAEDLITRAPIVTFLGHVDHGKTSLLDYLIGTKIVTGEAGGITQHIRAYQVKKDGRAVSFVDTPGHEAFTEMRARGANVTDIAILVIAADDGIMPQTEEAISHAKAAGVPIVVAANKCDLPGADINRIMTQMTEYGLTPSAWGGDVEVVPTSAITGEGMDTLLETLLTVAELNDYKANPKRAAMGVCLESEQSADRGVIAKVMVQTGTLRVGDIVLCGSTFGRVKALYDTLKRNKQLTEAGPSMPVNITGLERAPEAGEKFYVIDDIGQARELAAVREQESRATSLAGTSPKVSFETFQELLQSGKLGVKEDKVVLNLIVRADARGSLEAIEKELTKLDHPEVDIRILQKSVGGITVADVTLASASQAVIVGFNVIPDEAARILADAKNVEVRRYDIIYNLANDIRALIEGRLKPEEKVVELGRAIVKAVFSVSRVGTIAGCFVAQGSIERGCRIRVHREGRKIGDYQLDTLRRVKDDVKEVNRGMECGIKLAGFNDVKVDDVLEAYKVEQVARTLDSSKS
jgi:translation initiation factor IF-2